MFTANRPPPTPPSTSPSSTNRSSCLSVESARARLSHDIRVALRRSGHAELRGVEVLVDGRHVTICGVVPTFYLKQLAQELARSVARGQSIDNQLEVRAVSYSLGD
jgi:osmotically-inducible protein OsmY